MIRFPGFIQWPLVPAQAGTQSREVNPGKLTWIPAYAGMSGERARAAHGTPDKLVLKEQT